MSKALSCAPNGGTTMSNSISLAEVMFKDSDLPLVRENDLFRVALEVLDSMRFGAVCVLDDGGKLSGIMTDGDVRRIVLQTQDPLPKLFVKSVRELMTRDPITIGRDATLEQALHLMNKRLIWVLPVVDEEGSCIGLLHMQFALKAYLDISKGGV